MAYTPELKKYFRSFPGDQTNNIANDALQWIDFYHVPTGKSVKFKAMITAFADQYTSNWNTEDAYGRMDPIATFQKTGRVVNFSFDVVAGSESEAEENLAKSQSLIQMLYPVYSGNTMKNSPMLEIMFSNLIQNITDGTGLLGFLSGIEYAPNFDIGTYVDDYGSIYPKVVQFTCQFTVMHEHKLGWSGQDPIYPEFPYGESQFYDDETKEAKREVTATAGAPTATAGSVNIEKQVEPPLHSSPPFGEDDEEYYDPLRPALIAPRIGTSTQDPKPALKAIAVSKTKKTANPPPERNPVDFSSVYTPEATPEYRSPFVRQSGPGAGEPGEVLRKGSNVSQKRTFRAIHGNMATGKE